MRCGSRPRLSTGGMCGHPDPAHWPPVSPSLPHTQAFLLPEWTDLVPTCPLHLLLLHLEPAPRPRPSSPPGSSSSLSSSSHAPRHRLPEPPGFSSRPVSCCRFNLIVELPGSDGVLCTRLFPHRGSVSRGHRPRSAAVQEQEPCLSAPVSRAGTWHGGTVWKTPDERVTGNHGTGDPPAGPWASAAPSSL